jgi:hypothetical protein
MLVRIQLHTLHHGRIHFMSSMACKLKEIPCSDSAIEVGTEFFGEYVW